MSALILPFLLVFSLCFVSSLFLRNFFALQPLRENPYVFMRTLHIVPDRILQFPDGCHSEMSSELSSFVDKSDFHETITDFFFKSLFPNFCKQFYLIILVRIPLESLCYRTILIPITQFHL